MDTSEDKSQRTADEADDAVHPSGKEEEKSRMTVGDEGRNFICIFVGEGKWHDKKKESFL